MNRRILQICVLVVAFAGSSPLWGLGIRDFSGSSSFTVPLGINQVRFQAWGGGGGGLGTLYGGGSGAYLDVPVAVIPGETLTVQVGAGGAGAASGTAGTGGNTTLLRGATPLATAGGGRGGNNVSCPMGPCLPNNGIGGGASGPAGGILRNGNQGQGSVFMPAPYPGPVVGILPSSVAIGAGAGGAGSPSFPSQPGWQGWAVIVY